jgi:hypothetical protein
MEVRGKKRKQLGQKERKSGRKGGSERRKEGRKKLNRFTTFD